MTLVDLLGPKLLTSGPDQVTECDTAEKLKGAKAIGLYFSAHWCPPCRGFTPKLAEMYTKTFKDLGLEIVFVSSDQDQKAFDEYFAEQPWLALPYDARDVKAKLSKKYKVSGIPSFVILDSEGNTITTDGRSSIMEDPEGKSFPWTPKPFSEIIEGATVVAKDGSKSKLADLKGKKVGLYFSAHWCPPCKGFTPQLVDTYKKIKEDGKDFEIVFVSSDRDEEAFKSYYDEMPWMALDYSDRDSKNLLSKHFDVEGIPTFVILDEDMKIITANARGAVSSDPEGKEFPWEPKPVNSIEEPEGINDTPSLCVLMEKLSVDAQKPVRAVMDSVAAPALAKAKAAETDPEVIFFVAEKEGNIATKVRELAKQGDANADKANVILLDCGDGGAYYEFPGDDAINEDTIKAFLKAFSDGELKKKTFD